MQQYMEEKVFKDPDLTFHWIPLIDALGELLAEQDVATKLEWTYSPVTNAEGEEVYSHFTTCKWMKEGKQQH
jgi:hypothetical protein